MENNGYYVIGGQYESCCYGHAETLLGAKRKATANREYWDNWQGWHTPMVYSADDVVEIESKGRVTTCDGMVIVVPKDHAIPAAAFIDGKWIDDENDLRFRLC